MRLVLIRHAIAVPHGTPGVEEDERPLTEYGRKRFRSAARSLAKIVRAPDALLTSPLPRAIQTAEIAAQAWVCGRPVQVPALAQGAWQPVVQALSAYPSDGMVALVGHEPHLSGWLARWLEANGPEPFRFRKGGAALLDLPDGPRRHGALLWFLPPRVLVRIGER